MNINKKLLFSLVFVEIQIILILLICLIAKILVVEQKVERTNKFLFSVIQDENIVALQNLKPDDIIVGDSNAPVVMILYTKFDCSACNDFYNTTYEKLLTNYVDKGLLKIVIRYLTHSDNKESFYAAKCAQYSYNNDVFNTYNKLMVSPQKELATSTTKEATLSILPDTAKLNAYLANNTIATSIFAKAKEARVAGIKRTPTIIINGQILVGNRRFKKLEQLIKEEMKSR